MNKPKITQIFNGWSFFYSEANLTFEVTNITKHRDKTTAQIAIKAEDSQFLHRSERNITSTRSQQELANILKSRHKARVDWQILIEQLCNLIIDLEAQGEPVRELWTYEDISPPEFLLEPILYKGLPTIIFGEKGVTKSILALIIYTCLSLPWEDNPLGWVTLEKAVKVLLADYETEYEIAQYNIKRLKEGMGLPDFPLYYRRCSLPLVDDIEQIRKHLADLKAEVIIIDSLGPAVGGDLFKPEQALKFTTALRQLKVSSLILGQTSKEDIKDKSVFGTVFFTYFARNIFELRKEKEESEEKLNIALFHKYCNLDKRRPAMGFEINFNKAHLTIERQAITAPEFVERLGTQVRIKELLGRTGQMSVKDIAEALELTENNTRVVLFTLKKKGQVVKLDKGWGLASKEEKLF